MAYGYYMTPAERERYDQQRLFQSIASVGQTSPYYALGLALGQGLGNAYGNMAEERQANKLDAFVNEQLSPSTKIKMQDEYLKGMLQPDAQNEIKTLANTAPGQMNAIGEASAVQVPEQQGFNAPTRTDISEYARQNGVSNKVLNNRMADYQEQIKERAREYYVPRIGNLVENGALTNNNGLAQLYNETRQYSVYDDEGAKNVMSALGQMAKPVNVINKAPTQRTLLNSNVGGTKNENTTTTDTRRNQNNGLQYKFADLMTLRKQYTDSYNSAVTNGDDTAAQAYKQQIDNLDGLINKTLYPQQDNVQGGNNAVADDDYTDFAKEYPEEYEDKTYQELATELGVLPNNIANFGRAEEPKKEPVVNTPKVEQKAETPKTEQKTEGGGYVFNVDNDIQRLNAMRTKDGKELTLEQKKNFITNNKKFTDEQKAALLAKL